MAKKTGLVAAVYKKSGTSTAAPGEAMEQVGTSLWYKISTAAKRNWDPAHPPTVYDGATPITDVKRVAYAGGRVLLSSAPSGAVTVDCYYFAMTQFGGFNQFSIDEEMTLVDSSCYEDGDADVVDPTSYAASGRCSGFMTCVQSTLSTTKGDDKDLTFEAAVPYLGSDGNAISVVCAVAGNNTPLTVSRSGPDVTINSATDGGGVATSTARDVRDALLDDVDIQSNVLTCRLKTGSDGTGVFGDLDHTHLSGGVDMAELSNLNDDIVIAFYLDYSGDYRVEGVVQFEGIDISNGGIKELIGKTLRWKAVGFMYEHSG